MVTGINWRLLSDALAHYGGRGYQYVEAKWIEEQRFVDFTAPSREFVMSVEGHGDLVGSAEQSLVAMTARGEIGPGWYMACTPCFRNETWPDDLHHFYFMKVELFRNIQVGTVAADDILETAMEFFTRNVPEEFRNRLSVEFTPQGCDITLGGIEIGSYGHRSVNGISWVYGTGLAEPRFSTALLRATSA